MFAEELPGFFNLLLDITPAQIKATLKPLGDSYKQALLETETAAMWCQQTLAYAPEECLPIGTKEYKFSPEEYLYPNYRKWMQENGFSERETLALTKFSPRIVNLLTDHIGLSQVFIERKGKGMMLYGVRFREKDDPEIII